MPVTWTALVGRVLDDLSAAGLLESTVVILTSDHGTEFNENGQGFTGHGTSFSAYQVQTPLCCAGRGGRPPGSLDARLTMTSRRRSSPASSGAPNPPADYASGQSLFSEGAMGAGSITLSHNDFALLEPDQVTIVYPSGSEVRDQNYRLLPHPPRLVDKLRAAMQEMRRFYR